MSESVSHVRAVVINVVYDGPPRAGKTTSIRALARSFGREVYTPEERDGRTVFFDWLDHIGGRFEGAPIHCQVASVPGQRRWTRRRAHFLERADVIIFVGDTTARGWPETIARLRELREQLDGRAGVPVGLVFQANKRDCTDAIALTDVKAGAVSARAAIVESSAADSAGVREAFVFAVRLALDRVREELNRGAHEAGRWQPTPVSSELVDRLRELEPERSSLGTRTLPNPPAHDVPSGFVWPPIEGRILLREAEPSKLEEVHFTPEGDCVTTRHAWCVQSRRDDVYSDLDKGREALLAWAREHTAAHGVVSPRRCIVLAATGGEEWRLWQLVHRYPTLHELVERDEITLDAARKLVAELRRIVAELALRLPCTLHTVGMTELSRPVFVGLMPSAIREVTR